MMPKAYREVLLRIAWQQSASAKVPYHVEANALKGLSFQGGKSFVAVDTAPIGAKAGIIPVWNKCEQAKC